MSVNFVMQRVLRLSMILSIVSGSLVKKNEPLTSLDEKTADIDLELVSFALVHLLASHCHLWWNSSICSRRSSPSRYRRLVSPRNNTMDIEPFSQVRPSISSSITAGDGHHQVALLLFVLTDSGSSLRTIDNRPVFCILECNGPSRTPFWVVVAACSELG